MSCINTKGTGKMIALNCHCNPGNTQKLLQIYRLQTAIFITKLELVPG